MTTTYSNTTAPLSDEKRAAAIDLIRELATVAGDEARVLAVLADSTNRLGIIATQELCAATVLIVFGECLRFPAEPGSLVPLDLPTDTTYEGEPA
jgi:hypothetical protein